MTALESITAAFAKGEGVTLKVTPKTIPHARDLVRLAQRRTGVDVTTFIAGEKMVVEVVGR